MAYILVCSLAVGIHASHAYRNTEMTNKQFFFCVPQPCYYIASLVYVAKSAMQLPHWSPQLLIQVSTILGQVLLPQGVQGGTWLEDVGWSHHRDIHHNISVGNLRSVQTCWHSYRRGNLIDEWSVFHRVSAIQFPNQTHMASQTECRFTQKEDVTL